MARWAGNAHRLINEFTKPILRLRPEWGNHMKAGSNAPGRKV